MYIPLVISLSLLGLLTINSVASLFTWSLWHASARITRRWSGSARAQFLFVLRVAPSLIAIFCVCALFIPSFLTNEPRNTSEVVTLKLGIVAAASLYGIGYAAWRGLARCCATRRLMQTWMKNSEPVSIRALAIPAYRFRCRFPVVAIAGVFRPRLFVADQILEALTPAELAAAVQHEKGHLSAWDNLKRSMLRVCRDAVPLLPWGRSMDTAWNRAVELAADERAALEGSDAALDLASALVKIARLAPKGTTPAMPAGASLILEDPGGISQRVLRLTELSSNSGAPRCAEKTLLNLATGACASGLAITVLLTALSPTLMAGIHATLECVVSAFQ